MILDNALKNVSVIGAAGKMGRGMSLLLLQLMARHGAESGNEEFQLVLIDANDSLLSSLQSYLEDQLLRFAERNINSLRKWYASDSEVIDNEEVVNTFVHKALRNIRYGSVLELAKDSHLIFEAIIEDIEVKSKVLASLKSLCKQNPYYFTNTSSIPISTLAAKSHVGSHLIGYHFYNPPAVQKLLEIIVPENTDPDLKTMATQLAARLEKKVVFSKDVAGFIGNGYFIRETGFTLFQVKKLTESISLVEAMSLLNRLTQDYLVRPMGTFQLLDYVGIDVCKSIVHIMKTYIPGLNFDENLIDKMIGKGMMGGQFPDGLQKEGFFQYEAHSPVRIYDIERKTYIPISEIKKSVDERLGSLPKEFVSWKNMSKDSPAQRESKLTRYFHSLFLNQSLGSQLTEAYLTESRNIATNLVRDSVARSIEDVTTVLENGFFHLYGPNNHFLPTPELNRRSL